MLRNDVLRREKDFSAIYGKGKSVAQRHVVVFYRKNGMDYNRTAFLASKKVGNAVVRNRARRLMKESYREISSSLIKGYDLIFIARKNIKDVKCGDVKISMRNAAKKARLLEKRN